VESKLHGSIADERKVRNVVVFVTIKESFTAIDRHIGCVTAKIKAQ
jgi:hypothetical protein